MKLTQTIVGKLLPSKRDQIFFDDELPGFGLRLRAGGSRKYVVHYRQAGVQRRHTIGSAAVLTLEEARKRARKILVTVDDGKNPAAEKAARRAAAGLLFSAVADDYLNARQRDVRPQTLRLANFYLKHHWKPLHQLPVGAVDRALIAAHLRNIANNSGAVSANRARSTLSAMYAWAIGEGLCETNPVLGTNTAQERPRERVLSDTELGAIWNALPDSDYGSIVKLLMLTGQRREEISALQWPEIDFDARLITLSGSRTKNYREHEIPVSDAAMTILSRQIRREGRELVFGEGRDGYKAFSVAKKALDHKTGIVDHWTLHDLRRTTATGMADLGVQPHVIEAVLNHISGHKAGVAGIYNRSSYAAEKRAALQLWADHLATVVAQASGANVTPLRKT
jgi:integrase